jgi:beta-xylosidase
VATASSPAGKFHDATSGPIVCQNELGGSIDPQPFIDADGTAWLHWKNNDGSSGAVSKVWAVPLAADGVSLAGFPREVMAKDTVHHPWQTTVDNPAMVLEGGVYYLFHTGGDYVGNDTYSVGYATCAGPAGPCTTIGKILSSYGNAAGPGGGNVARGSDGTWWISYHAWTKGCTSYSCGGKRKLYTAPLHFG